MPQAARTRVSRARLLGVSGMRSEIKLHIQFQPDLVIGLDLSEFTDILKSESVDFSVTKGNDDGEYINYDFSSTNIKESWELLKSIFEKDKKLVQSSIVCCEGCNGWDDYLLLSHYDPNEKIDEIKNH